MAKQSEDIDYKALSDELDAILDKLQSGELDIDAAMPAYERGMVLIQQLEAHLQTAENTITALQATDGA